MVMEDQQTMSHDGSSESEQIQYNLTMTSVESNHESFHQCYQLSDEELGKGSYSTVYRGSSIRLPTDEKCEKCSPDDKMIEMDPAEDDLVSQLTNKESVGRNNFMPAYRGISIHRNDVTSVKEVMSTDEITVNENENENKNMSGNEIKNISENSNSPTYAIKQIPKEKLRKEDVKSIFDEVAILQHLNHPHIIQLHDFFDEDQFYFLVMERVTGGELFDRIIEKGCYNENEARSVCKILLNAVAYMHNQGIAHRDLKPDNLLLVEKGNDTMIKVVDFGFSKRCDDSSNDGMGDLKTVCGTPTYMSPEIVNRLPYGTKSDMWSVGILLYILLGGYPPFIDDDQAELFRKISNCDYEFYPEEFNKVSDDAKDLISSLLEVNPKKRLSAREALDDLWICSDDVIIEETNRETSRRIICCRSSKFTWYQRIIEYVDY